MGEQGRVYLVGAGPGDIGLITVKGLHCLREADVILYDHLVDPRLLAKAKQNAELICVGKEAGKTGLTQEIINATLVAKAKEGKIVTRLKGGDPFVLGRGAEEAETLAQHGIPFEIVPGVTSAVAVPAYAGIPVTHRHLASSLAIVTGQEDRKKDSSKIAWDKIATSTDTLVFLMGVEKLKTIVERLTKYGRPASTPVALIRWGTTPRQQTLVGTLADIVTKAEAANLRPPAVMVVGEVVTLSPHLRWFDNRPLFGKRVLVTRAHHQASELANLLAQEGAEPVEMPTIEIKAPSSWTELDCALRGLHEYNWIVFTSANGVDAFFRQLYYHNYDARQLANNKVCALGPATAAELIRYGIQPDLIPEVYSSQGIISRLGQESINGSRFLLARSEIASQELVDGLTRLGAQVKLVTTYTTVPAQWEEDRVKQILSDRRIDIVTFTSPSTVQGFIAAKASLLPWADDMVTACIGPVTAAAAVQAGLNVNVVASEYTVAGLVHALVEYEEHSVR